MNTTFNIFSKRRILITGHTGFKGSWLSLWLQLLGAEVIGYSLAPEHDSHYNLLTDLDINSHVGDIRDSERLHQVMQQCQPELVFHLAAQPLVRRSFQEPVSTISTNVMGTVNLLEACRSVDSVTGIVVITTDKCYAEASGGPYLEGDPLGGDNPYSASKACAELVTQAWSQCFYQRGPLCASARAGNVIGGGDMGVDRLVPDLVRGAISGSTVAIRYPQAIRPWQHVLDCLCGYLKLGAKLLQGQRSFIGAWNFGPPAGDELNVGELAQQMKEHWPAVNFHAHKQTDDPHEAPVLRLDSSVAFNRLGWRPLWNMSQCLEHTVQWYRCYAEQKVVLTQEQISAYQIAVMALETEKPL